MRYVGEQKSSENDDMILLYQKLKIIWIKIMIQSIRYGSNYC